MPELVRAITGSDDPKEEATLSVIYQDLIAILTVVIQEQNVRLRAQDDKIRALEGLVSQTSHRLTALEAHFLNRGFQNLTMIF